MDMKTPAAGKKKASPLKNSERDAESIPQQQPNSKKPRTTTSGNEELSLNVLETTVEGQMKLHPDFTEDEARAAAKKGKTGSMALNCWLL